MGGSGKGENFSVKAGHRDGGFAVRGGAESRNSRFGPNGVKGAAKREWGKNGRSIKKQPRQKKIAWGTPERPNCHRKKSGTP